MSWDIIKEESDFKILEVSNCFYFNMVDNQLYYDIKEEKILKMKNKLKDNPFLIQYSLLQELVL